MVDGATARDNNTKYTLVDFDPYLEIIGTEAFKYRQPSSRRINT